MFTSLLQGSPLTLPFENVVTRRSLVAGTTDVLHTLAHLRLELQCGLRQHHHTSIVNVEDVVLVHDPPAKHLGSILGKPPGQRPDPHKSLQRLGCANNEALSLDTIWRRTGPECGTTRRTGERN